MVTRLVMADRLRPDRLEPDGVGSGRTLPAHRNAPTNPSSLVTFATSTGARATSASNIITT
jgi:hypothetical protein